MSRRSRLAVSMLLSAAPLLLGSTGLDTRLDERLLAAHNRERSAAGLPPLAWNAELARSAEAWASHLSITGRFEHAPRDPDAPGENLWAGTAGYFSPEAMVGLWIDEKKDFTPGAFPDNSRTGHAADVGHYTQLMWRRSGEVGCAVARGPQEDVLVCRYQQAGNVIGERPF